MRTACCSMRSAVATWRRGACGRAATSTTGARASSAPARTSIGRSTARTWAPRLLRHLDRAVEKLVGVDALDVEGLVDADVVAHQLVVGLHAAVVVDAERHLARELVAHQHFHQAPIGH